MQELNSKIEFKINPGVFKKDALSSDLGVNIVEQGIDQIVELGFENFTFKKLAQKINSTEASVYRYFESKQHLLSYLTQWYWNWLEYRIIIGTLNIPDPKIRLENAIKCLTEEIKEDQNFSRINEVKLHQIVITESSKVYMCKSVDENNASGFYQVYKSLVQRVADIILEISPKFKYPHMLVSTIIEGAHHQRFFADHLPRLTDQIENEDAVTSFYIQLANRQLRIEK